MKKRIRQRRKAKRQKISEKSHERLWNSFTEEYEKSILDSIKNPLNYITFGIAGQIELTQKLIATVNKFYN